MNLKHDTLEIVKENPFQNCKLNRQKYAETLTSIISYYPYGFVLALNNKWGAGKTTFVKMWEQSLINDGYQTIYFNAWENDFENNPLIALMGELKKITNKTNEKEFKSALKKAAIVTKHIAPILAQAIAEKYIKIDNVKEAIVQATKGLSDIFENSVDEYSQKKKSLSDFRKSLSEFIAKTSTGRPLIFIVDELDRCRPDYAVSILEQIKHFFSVPNIVFILSIDKKQLGNAIKGVYGNDNIDSDEYLRRFIDIEYSIPEPEADIFYKYLYDYFGFNEFFSSEDRSSYRELKMDGEVFLRTCKLLFSNKNIPLRKQEKILSLSRVALRSFSFDNYVVPQVFLFLTYIKITQENFYNQLRLKKLTISQFQEQFSLIVEDSVNERNKGEFVWMEAYLVNFYHNYLNENGYGKNTLLEVNKDTGKSMLLIDSIFGEEANINFLHVLEELKRGWRTEGTLEIGYLIKRIDLLETLKT